VIKSKLFSYSNHSENNFQMERVLFWILNLFLSLRSKINQNIIFIKKTKSQLHDLKNVPTIKNAYKNIQTRIF